MVKIDDTDVKKSLLCSIKGTDCISSDLLCLDWDFNLGVNNHNICIYCIHSCQEVYTLWFCVTNTDLRRQKGQLNKKKWYKYQEIIMYAKSQGLFFTSDLIYSNWNFNLGVNSNNLSIYGITNYQLVHKKRIFYQNCRFSTATRWIKRNVRDRHF